MSDKGIASSSNERNHADASVALLSDHNQMTAEQTQPSDSWLRTIVDYVPDHLHAPKVVSNVLPTLVKTAALFYPGAAGVAGYVAMSALDQAHPNDSLKNQAEDFALGATKGALMVGAFRATAELPTNALGLAGRGATLGVASRLLDSGLDRHTYINPNTGAVDLAGGLSNVFKTTFQPGALAIDAATFAVAGGLAQGATSLTRGALAGNLAATNAMTGGIFGFSSGAFNELRQEQVNKQSISPLSILGQGLESGAVMAVAAIPGGLKMQHDLNVANTARTESRQEQSSPNGARDRIIPGPGHTSHDGSDQPPLQYNAQVAANDNNAANDNEVTESGAKAKVIDDAEKTQAANDPTTELLTTRVFDKAAEDGRPLTLVDEPKVDMNAMRVEFSVNKDGAMTIDPSQASIRVNDQHIEGPTVIKPTDSIKVDIGDRYPEWRPLAIGQIGSEPSVQGFTFAPGRPLALDFNSLFYAPDVKADADGNLTITPTRSNPDFRPGSYREPGSSIRMDADGHMVLHTNYENVFRINGGLVPKGDMPISQSDSIQADVGDRFSVWKTLPWSKIAGNTAIEGHPLTPGHQLRFDPDTLVWNPRVAIDSTGRQVLTGPKIPAY